MSPPLRKRQGSLGILTLQTAFAAGLAALLAGSASAAITPYFYLRGGDTGNYRADATPGSTRAFTSGFSTSSTGGGLTGQDSSVLWPIGAGGPLGGPAGPVSAVSIRWGSFNTRTSGMWIEGPNGQPTADQWSMQAQNWVMEGWILPVENGTTLSSGSRTAIIFSNGSNNNGAAAGGLRFRIGPMLDETGTPTEEQAVYLEDIARTMPNPFDPEGNPVTLQVGDPVPMDITKWMHVAAVNDAGTVTFYVNGVANGAPATGTSAPSGSPTVGSGPDTRLPYNGYLDEVRWSTFAPGAFSVNDLLLRPPGPSILTQPPAAVSVWNGGPAPFSVDIAYDESAAWQWKLGGTAVGGATSPEYVIPAAAAANNGVYTADITSGGVTVTSGGTTLTVVPNKTEDTDFYRAGVLAEGSLVSFFPVDGDTAATATNTKNAALNGALDEKVTFDGRTDRSLGQRALRFKGSGGVTVPANAAFDFAAGTGTIEALVYLDAPGNSGEVTLFSVSEGDSVYTEFRAGVGGATLVCDNDTLESPVTWSVPTLLKKRLAHVAFVFSGGTVTAYVDGESLGTKAHATFGASTGLPLHIGSGAPNFDGVAQNPFHGAIDEIAIYSGALSAYTVAVHDSRFKFGTAVTAPNVTSQPTGPFNLLAGGAPAFRVVSGGTTPLLYQWKRNGVDVTGNPTATTSTLVLNNSTTESSGEYTVTVTNPQGSDTSDPFTVNFAAPPDSYSGFVLADNPTSYWRVNETSGTVMKDYAGGLDGTYSTSATLNAEPLTAFAPDPALRLTGSGNPIPASVPYTPVLNPSGAFSVEAWVKPTASGNTGRAILSTQNRNAGRSGYVLYQGFNPVGWESHIGVGESVKFLQSNIAPVAGRWDHLVVTWDGDKTARLFVNGVEAVTHVDGNGDAAQRGPFRPNLAQPLEFGSRFGGGIPWDGTVDEVAFYNHALTLEQVRKHHSVTWVPATVTQDLPAAADATETGTLTLTAQVGGYPNTYQWLKNGEPLIADGRFPQGVTSPTLVINNVGQDDAGSYQLVVTNPLGDKTTATTAVTFVPDLTPPTLAYAAADGSMRRVRVGFSRPITPETASVPANYTVSGGLTVVSVVPTTNGMIADLVLSAPMAEQTAYIVSVSGVRDQRVSHNLIAPTSTLFTSLVFTPGYLSTDFYGGIPGNGVEELRADLQFPDGVWHSTAVSSFSTRELTGGDLNTKPEYSAMGLGENYGTRVYGWITPTVSGSYTFFLDSDDGAELNMSPDADPSKADVIALVAGNACCQNFKEPNPNGSVPETSQPVDLVAGKSYYIEALQKEGGGGDYVRVAWRIAGDTTKSVDLLPIPGAFLSGYALPGFASIPITGGIGTPVLADGYAIISWGGPGTLQESDDLVTWTDVPGNPKSPYVSTATGKKFYRVITVTP